MRRRGGALVITLAVSAGLLSLVLGLAAAHRAEFRRSIAYLESQKAREMAQAGLERALVELGTVDPNAVLLSDPWALIGEGNAESFLLEDGSFRIEILDEGSFVSLNTAGTDQLLNLGLTTEQADSLMDWREAGSEPRPEGAKDEYYNTLLQPYNAALRPLRSLDELLLVKGFTARTLWEWPEERASNVQLVQGSDEDQPVLAELATVWSSAPFTRSGGQPRVNVNTANQQQLVQAGLSAQFAQAIIQRRNVQGTFTSLGQVLAVNGATMQNAPVILNNLSTSASTVVAGRINLNTASEAALNSLPNSSPDITQAILTRQSQGFQGVGDLTTVPGVTMAWLQQNADQFAVGSQAFRVRVLGRSGGAAVALEGIVSLAQGGPRLLATFDFPFRDAATRWRWEAEPTTDVVLAEAP